VAIPVIQSKSENTLQINGESLGVVAPAGITDGDVLVIFISNDGNVASSYVWPTGFIPIYELNQDINNSLGCAYKIASSESGIYVVSWTGSQTAIIEMYRVDGAVSGNEIQDPDESTSGTGASPTITPVASTDTDDSLVFVSHGMDDDDVTVDGGGDADYNLEDVDKNAAGAGTCSIGIQTKGIATAAVPPACTLTLLANEQFVIGWFAIRSIAPAGGVTVLAALAIATALSPVSAIVTGAMVSAVLATATALSPVSTHINTVSAPVATATALSPVSIVSGVAVIVGALATASALSPDATVLVGGAVVVLAVLATATALSYTATHLNTLPGALATATALSFGAAVSVGTLVAAILATATALSASATVTVGTTVTAVLATAITTSWAASINPGATISAVLATATALAYAALIVVSGKLLLKAGDAFGERADTVQGSASIAPLPIGHGFIDAPADAPQDEGSGRQ